MKNLLVLPLILTGALLSRAQDGDPTVPPGRVVPSRPIPIPNAAGSPEAPPAPPRDSGFSRFNINFLGGPPAKLVQLITNQTRKPLNVIIPPDYADTELPPLNLNGVTAPQLFEALGAASRRKVNYAVSSYGGGGGIPGVQTYQQGTTGFGFKSAGGVREEDSIWYFFVDSVVVVEPPKGPPPPSDPMKTTVCRFFQLGPYLQSGLKIEDITTALDAGWKMMGETIVPKIKFHQDTKLLIAVGPADKLMIIDQMLEKLPRSAPTGRVAPIPLPFDPATGLPVPPGGMNLPPPENNNNLTPAKP